MLDFTIWLPVCSLHYFDSLDVIVMLSSIGHSSEMKRQVKQYKQQ